MFRDQYRHDFKDVFTTKNLYHVFFESTSDDIGQTIISEDIKLKKREFYLAYSPVIENFLFTNFLLPLIVLEDIVDSVRRKCRNFLLCIAESDRRKYRNRKRNNKSSKFLSKTNKLLTDGSNNLKQGRIDVLTRCSFSSWFPHILSTLRKESLLVS